MFNQLKSMAGVDSLEEMVSVASFLLMISFHTIYRNVSHSIYSRSMIDHITSPYQHNNLSLLSSLLSSSLTIIIIITTIIIYRYHQVSSYIAHEEEMFSLYNFIQTVNAEIDAVSEATLHTELEILKYRDEQQVGFLYITTATTIITTLIQALIYVYKSK
jgi:hypothetical protein